MLLRSNHITRCHLCNHSDMKTTLHFSLLAILSLTQVGNATAAPPPDINHPGSEWTEAYRKDTTVIFTKDAGSSREIMAFTAIKARPEAVFNVICDFGHYSEFMPYVEESRVLRQISPHELITYQRIAPPFVSERDYPTRMKITRDVSASLFTIEWRGSPDSLPEIDDVIRISLNQGSWHIEPADADRQQTRLTYRVLVDPGGAIPAFVANLSGTVAVPGLLEAVRKRLSEEKGPPSCPY